MDSVSPTLPLFNNTSPAADPPDRDARTDSLAPAPVEQAQQPLPASSATESWTSLQHEPTPPHLLYSPTQAEIDAHPIRKRLSLARDSISTGLGSAPPPLHELVSVASAAAEAESESRQASEGSSRERNHEHIRSMGDNNDVQKGDEVSYQWSGGRPGGTVADVATEGNVTMETKRGNEVKKKGDEENPALYIERSGGHDVVKKASEVDVEKKAEGGDKDDEKDEKNGEPKTGDKRAAEETLEEKKDEEGDAKKQKTDAEPKENGEKAKKKGRPAKNANGPKKETKKKAPKRAATESGEPRRSGRNASKA